MASGYSAIRAISSDRLRVVSGADDTRVLVWDKASEHCLEELKGHQDRVLCFTSQLSYFELGDSHGISISTLKQAPLQLQVQPFVLLLSLA
jgi:WD40 repeat protein